MLAGSLARQEQEGRQAGLHCRCEFLIGRLLFDAADNLGLLEPIRKALASLGVDIESLRERGAGRGARQWRARAPCGLLHGKHGHPAHSAHRLRNPLQSRPVPPGDRRTAGSTSIPKDWLAFGNPWEFDAPAVATHRLRRTVSADDAHGRRCRTGTQRPIWQPAEMVFGDRLRHAGGRLARPTTRTRCACGRPARLDPLRPRRIQPGDHVGALRARARANCDLADPLSERRYASRPGICGCARNFFSPRIAAGSGGVAISARFT